MLTNDYNSDYKDLLEIIKTSTMEIKRLTTLALEVFKTVNNLNPDFMKDIFYLSPYQTHKKYDIFVHSKTLQVLVIRAFELLDYTYGIPCMKI